MSYNKDVNKNTSHTKENEHEGISIRKQNIS